MRMRSYGSWAAIRVWGPTPVRSLTLSAISEMHDRLIAATALHRASPALAVRVVTCDADITSSGLVPVVW